VRTSLPAADTVTTQFDTAMIPAEPSDYGVDLHTEHLTRAAPTRGCCGAHRTSSRLGNQVVQSRLEDLAAGHLVLHADAQRFTPR